jgi:hypothetical protein
VQAAAGVRRGDLRAAHAGGGVMVEYNGVTIREVDVRRLKNEYDVDDHWNTVAKTFVDLIGFTDSDLGTNELRDRLLAEGLALAVSTPMVTVGGDVDRVHFVQLCDVAGTKSRVVRFGLTLRRRV